MDCNRARTKDPGEWLQTCPDFSQPIAEQLVEWILTWEPDLAESIKWNNLCFSGRKNVLGMSGCQRHVALFFFRGTELPDPAQLFTPGGEANTNIRSIRITTLAGLNCSALRELLHAAVALDADPTVPAAPKESGVRVQPTTRLSAISTGLASTPDLWHRQIKSAPSDVSGWF